ncbi:TIGR02186 family protein [Sandarakinorhabdus sp. AAP62]|uniref:TIGR02186 family protein n=1 Tax=Sandarakinorhabdus sp. AAP62 TaxID=1248916 RepID=UPI0003015978|nr:TIGR02186 family protein [Sandarakinorhabdus sp. AAP62]
MIGRILLALGLWLALVGAAPIRLITQLSQARIEINTTFRGSEMLVFGAIQYPQGSVPDAPPDIAVVVRGPSAPVTVRQKARIAGIWVNAAGVRFESVPGFYAVAATRPIDALADERTTAIYEIGIRNLQLSPASGADDDVSRAFEAGLIAARQKAGLFSERPDGVQITRGVLYAARIALPAAVPVGDYTAEIHLVRQGRVLASTSAPFLIDKSGFERWVYVMAQDNSLAYGLVAVMAALAAGAIAALVTRRRW